jgi:hypothetical protein
VKEGKRMKNKIIKITLMLMFVITSSSFADINFGVFGSLNEASDIKETLIGGGGKIEFDINSQISFDFRISYEMAKVDDYIHDNSYSDTADIALLPFVFSLNWNIPVSYEIIPYIGAGVGYYIPLQDIDDANSEFGGNIHGGLKLQISDGVQIFGEAKYRILDMDGNDMSGLGIIAGISFGSPSM